MAAHVLTQQIIAHALRDGARVRQAVLERCLDDVARAATLVAEATAGGRKILLVGNGSSAADAQHIAAELAGRFAREKAPVPALALTLDTSAITQIGNDFGFEQIFARQVRAMGQPGDVLVALSTTGDHPNVLAAIDAARDRGMRVLGLTGTKGRELASMCDVCVVIPSTNRARIHELHVTIGHVICEIVEAHRVAREARSAGGLRLVSDGQSGAEPAVLGPVPSSDRLTSTSKDLSLSELVALRERWRAEGRLVVWMTGTFDVLQATHVTALQTASRLGDVLVVGLLGAGAASPTADRVALLSALEAVDHVLVLGASGSEAIAALKPDVVCRPEALAGDDDVVRGYGGRVERVPALPA